MFGCQVHNAPLFIDDDDITYFNFQYYENMLKQINISFWSTLSYFNQASRPDNEVI